MNNFFFKNVFMMSLLYIFLRLLPYMSSGVVLEIQNKKKSYFGQYKHNFNILNIKLDVDINVEKTYYDNKRLKNLKKLKLKV